MDVKYSLTLWKEEMPWVKGLVGLNIEVERFPLGEGFVVHGVWAPLKPYALFFIMGGISVLM